MFCELRSIFPSPAGARKNASNEQNVREYYMLNHLIRGLLFHYKKVLFRFNFIWKGCFKKNASSVLQGACERCKQHKRPAKDLYLMDKQDDE